MKSAECFRTDNLREFYIRRVAVDAHKKNRGAGSHKLCQENRELQFHLKREAIKETSQRHVLLEWKI